MAKRRIGTLKGKPIVEGDSNLISKNEVNIKELGNTGGGSGAASLGLWDSDYLLIGNGNGSHPQYENIKNCLSVVASFGNGRLSSGDLATSTSYLASDFVYTGEEVAKYVWQIDDATFYTGVLRISNATLNFLSMIQMDKETGMGIFPSQLHESVSSLNYTPCILSDLDIFDAALILWNNVFRIIVGGQELSSKEEIKDIILSNERNRIIPAAEIKQLIIDNYKQ